MKVLGSKGPVRNALLHNLIKCSTELVSRSINEIQQKVHLLIVITVYL